MNRIGEINYNSYGTPMKIIEYKNSTNIIVEFQDEYKYKRKCEYGQFKKGQLQNPYDKTVYGVGYLGEGKYKSRGEDGKQTKVYQTWKSMLQRCYDPYRINKYPTYINCYVCDEWHSFQNFAKWFYKNYYEVESQRMHLDKDILIKGNKIYSPKTCVFVPERINYLFTKSDKARDNTPIGVHWHKRDGVYECHCSVLNKENKKELKYLGRYKNIIVAFDSYKTFKEVYIKQVADEYKDLIPKKLYDAMYKYKVEIND